MTEFAAEAPEFLSVYPRPVSECEAAAEFLDDPRQADALPDEAIAAGWWMRSRPSTTC